MDSTLPATEEDNSPIRQFREKVAERIRGDIGELMPDEMLQQIVKETISSELNRPVITNSHKGQPWIRKQIAESIETNLKNTVQTELAKQEKVISKAIKEAVKEAVPDALTVIILAMIKGNTYQIEQVVMNILNNQQRY